MRGRLSAIEATRARSLDDLLDRLSAVPAPRLIAGGTDVMVQLEAGAQKEGETFIDVSGLARELRYHRLDADALEIGALGTFRDTRARADIVSAFPLLELAARTIGATQTQTRGTWAGNIANGSPAADGVAALLAYDAEVIVASRGWRCVRSLTGFFSGYKKMNLQAGEFIQAIRLPRRPPDRWSAFHKVGTRRAQAITKVGLTLNWRANGSWRIVGTSLAPFVTRYETLEKLFEDAGDDLSRIDIHKLTAAVSAAVDPIDDIRSTADYRRKVVFNLLRDASAHARAG
ncbi:MAG TPA: FAD binding domain-containing protein [Candidatus Eisenbacteria bacterium]